EPVISIASNASHAIPDATLVARLHHATAMDRAASRAHASDAARPMPRSAGHATNKTKTSSPNSSIAEAKWMPRAAIKTTFIGDVAARGSRYGATSKLKSPSVTCVSTDTTRHFTR